GHLPCRDRFRRQHPRSRRPHPLRHGTVGRRSGAVLIRDGHCARRGLGRGTRSLPPCRRRSSRSLADQGRLSSDRDRLSRRFFRRVPTRPDATDVVVVATTDSIMLKGHTLLPRVCPLSMRGSTWSRLRTPCIHERGPREGGQPESETGLTVLAWAALRPYPVRPEDAC